MKGLKKNAVAFVVTAMYRGGAERVVSVLANNYAKEGFEVHIIMLWHNTVGYKLDERIKIHCFEQKGKNQYLKIPSVISKLRKKIKEISPGAVISFIAQNNIVSYYAVKGLGVRLLVSERIDPASMKRGKIYSMLLDHVYKNSSLTVLQTKRVLNFFPEKVRKNSIVIYNPVTVNCIADTKSHTIVTAGRLEKQKNHKMLISAFSEFYKNHPEYNLVIYGEGSLRSELETLIQEKGLNDVISLPGNINNVQEKISEAEIFVLSSDFEGMSNALMEAMAIGLPCISTDCAGSDELIEDRINGLLVKVGDESGLLNAMNYMAKNREHALKMGNAAREFSTVFSADNVISLWKSAIEGECFGE